MAGDFILHSDGAFLEWSKTLITYAAAHLMPFNVPETALTPIQAQLTAYETAFEAAQNPNRGKVDVLNKNETKAGRYPHSPLPGDLVSHPRTAHILPGGIPPKGGAQPVAAQFPPTRRPARHPATRITYRHWGAGHNPERRLWNSPPEHARLKHRHRWRCELNHAA
jgi:hypothetical protein